MDCDLINTKSNVLSSVRLPLLPAARSSNIRNIDLGGIKSVDNRIRKLLFYFNFVGKQYSIKLNVFLEPTLLIIFQQDFDEMGLKY